MSEEVKAFAKIMGQEQSLRILTAGQKEPGFEDFVSNGLKKAFIITAAVHDEK